MKTKHIRQLLATRYLILMIHLVLILTTFSSREVNVQGGLPIEYTEQDYVAQDYDFKTDLTLSTCFLITEIIFTFSGLTMFHYFNSLISVILHSFGSLALIIFITEEVDSYLFWWVFGLSNVVPVTMDLYSILMDLIRSGAFDDGASPSAHNFFVILCFVISHSYSCFPPKNLESGPNVCIRLIRLFLAPFCFILGICWDLIGFFTTRMFHCLQNCCRWFYQ